MRKAIQAGLVTSAHDISEGGLFITLLESAMVNNLGADIEMRDDNMRQDALLFGEAQSRIVVSVSPDQQDAFEALMTECKVPAELIGNVGGDSLSINGIEFGALADYQYLHENSLEYYMEKGKAIPVEE